MILLNFLYRSEFFLRNVMLLILSCVMMQVQAQSVDSIPPRDSLPLLRMQARTDTVLGPVNTHHPKSYGRAIGETIGMNLGLWAFDRYVVKGHYAYISGKTIKENFKHGFEWDNDHLNTNMFAHPYNGSLFFNAGRSNGFNYWQSELFAIGGSAMWELFMEREYPSTNDIIATPVGGAALGEVFYRTSDLLLDDRTTGGRRFGRELAAFLVSPMRGVNRVLTGQAWKKRTERGREFNDKPLHLELSVGTRILAYHDQDHLTKGGASARFNMEYGDRFNHDSKVPYDYFSFLAEFNLMKTQPLLSRIEIMGRLLSKDIVQTRHCDLSVGLFQHFDFFDSDTVSLHTPASFSPCTIPYKLGTPASVGAGAMFRYQNDHGHLDMEGHANGVLLGGILSDYYRYYHRNYNWAMGFSFKSGLNGYFLDDRLSFSFHHQFYRFYTRDTWNDETPWSETPGGKPVNVQGDDSVANFHHLEGQLNYKIWKKLFLSGRMDFYHRSTRYRGGMYWQDNYMSNWYVDSKQLSFQLMLSFLL